MVHDVDVLVVGGRVAGCLTALRLAANGVAVRLLEAHDFPSATLSTHFFRGDGLVRSLQDVGALDEVLATGAPPLRCEYRSEDGGEVRQDPPQEPGSIGYCLSVRRVTLDAILARRAAACGVDVRTRTRVVDTVSEGGACRGVLDHDGAVHRARVVVGADGRRSTVARLVGARELERHPAARAMYYRYASGWRSPDAVGPEFTLDGNRLSYVFPSDGGVACLAVSVPVAEHQHEPRVAAAEAVDKAFRLHRHTARRVADVEWIGGAFTGRPASSSWRVACGDGWALVGDSGTAQDPWSGLGMDTAARQAEAFAEAFVAAPDDWQATYTRLRSERTYPGFAETTALAPDLRGSAG